MVINDLQELFHKLSTSSKKNRIINKGQCYMKKEQNITNKQGGEAKVIETQFSRSEKLLGTDSVAMLHKKTVAIFGLGGVGSFVVEALVRAGIFNIVIVDNDVIVESNLNRQLFALHSSLGMFKTDCAKKRILDINPLAVVETFPIFYNSINADTLDTSLSKCDYIIDAIDTVSAKILLIEKAKKFNIPIISCMGTGNKLDASRFEIAEIEKTSVCPLARVMRRELKARHIKKVKVLYSREEPIKSTPPASISFVPSVAGLLIAGEVVRDLLRVVD